MMKGTVLMMIGMMMLSGQTMAQDCPATESLRPEKGMPKRPKKVTYEQMTKMMVKELQLDEKQQKKVAKLNKKYKTLIEGEETERPQGGQRPPMGERPSGNGGMPGGGMGGPGGGFGGGMPGGGMGGHGGMQGGPRGGGMPGSQSTEAAYDYDKKQKKYDKAIGKILTSQQFEGYQMLRPKFASQRKIHDFLLGGQQNLPERHDQ